MASGRSGLHSFAAIGCVLAFLLVAHGCARTGARPAGTPAPTAGPPPGRPAGTAPASPRTGEGSTAPGAAQARARTAPGDPGEVMTAAELATIPDPVPGADAAPAPGNFGRVPAGPAASRDTTGATADSSAPEPPPRADPSGSGPGSGSAGRSDGFLWRVQVYASPDLAQADRIAREASRRLEAVYVIQYEEALYKVRLGSFASEEEAQVLREKAVQGGFPGAFRVRTTADATGGRN